MAGVKGRSGGARPNSGGKRVGSGRKPVPPPEPEFTAEKDPLAYLIAVMQGTEPTTPLQLRAAIAAAQYVHIKKGDGGKKDEVAEKAKKAAAKFKPSAPPLKLVKQA